MKHDDGESFGIAAMDVLFNYAFIFVVLFAMQQVFTQIEKTEAKDGVTAGKMCVEIQWPYEQDVDMDLWVRGPNGQIIGYSNKNGDLFSLLRDDLGKYADAGESNMEMSCSTALQAGDYTLNVHYFSDRGVAQEVPVTLTLRFPTDGKSGPAPHVVKKTVGKPGDEVTFMDFLLDDKGAVIEGSINDVSQPLRSAK